MSKAESGGFQRDQVWCINFVSMKPSVYIETTIPSYLTAWRSPELVMAANQEATRKWWDEVRGNFEIFISALVVREVASGDSNAAKRRLEITPFELMKE